MSESTFIGRDVHESIVSHLKREIAIRDAELECRRKAQPGWSYNPKFGLYSDGASLGDLEALGDGIE